MVARKQRGVKREREENRTPPLQHPFHTIGSLPLSTQRLDFLTERSAHPDTRRSYLCSSSFSNRNSTVNSTGTVILDRNVPSTRTELNVLMELLKSVRQTCTLDETGFSNLVVAMTEAVNNAIVHGNGGDPELRVRYTLRCTPNGVLCTVEDEGEGFDPETLADPTDPVGLLQEGGRGVFLIRALTRDLRFERTPQGGMRLIFLCPNSDGAATPQ